METLELVFKIVSHHLAVISLFVHPFGIWVLLPTGLKKGD